MSKLDELLEAARKRPPMTADERNEQALSFAYGNLACTTNHKPSRRAFRHIAIEKYGWSDERFEKWAEGKEWEVP